MFGPPPPPPRPAPFGVASWNVRFALLFSGGWAGTAILVFVSLSFISRPFWVDWALDERGVRVDAVAIDVRSTRTSINDEDLFNLVLRFRDEREREHTVVVGTTNSDKIEIARAHGQISIEYDPEDPASARLTGERASALGLVGTLLLAVFAITGAPGFVVALRQLMRARRIYRHGTATQATVMRVVDTSSSQNDETVREMHYSFDTPLGPASGTWKTVEPLPQGGTLWVVYDPRSPNDNVPSLS